MEYEFKRGQIIPKKIGGRFISIHSKARHCLIFGADVVVTTSQTELTIELVSEGSFIHVKKTPARRRDNGTHQKCPVSFKDIHFINFGAERPEQSAPAAVEFVLNRFQTAAKEGAPQG